MLTKGSISDVTDVLHFLNIMKMGTFVRTVIIMPRVS